MASGPTRPVPYITFFNRGPTTQWTTTIFGTLRKIKTKQKPQKKKHMLEVSSEISAFFFKKTNFKRMQKWIPPEFNEKNKTCHKFSLCRPSELFCSHRYWTRLLHPPFPVVTQKKGQWREMSVHNNNMVTIYPFTRIYESNLGMVMVGSPAYHLRPSHLQHAFPFFLFGHKMPSEVHWKLNLISFRVGCW